MFFLLLKSHNARQKSVGRPPNPREKHLQPKILDVAQLLTNIESLRKLISPALSSRRIGKKAKWDSAQRN